jgi:hypothetical protein
VSDDNIESVCEAFQRSPRESVAKASRKLGIPKNDGVEGVAYVAMF